MGDQREVLVIDAAHDHRPIVDAIGGRQVTAIFLTHGHNDHINAAVPLAQEVHAPIWIHPQDRVLWDMVYPGCQPDRLVSIGSQFEVGGASLAVLHTPGHTNGSCCLYHQAGGTLFSGDTLFQGGPGATGRSFSDFPTIIESIRSRLLTLPAETRVYPGHGAMTTVGDEAPHLPEWVDRGF